MQQWTAKFKHTIRDGKKVSKKQEAILLSGVSYSDAEQIIAKFIEKEGYVNPSDPDIAKFQYHEILGYNPDIVSEWWKARIKCVSEDANGKISIFYIRYLVFADELKKALKLIEEKEKQSVVPGMLESINITKLSHLLVSVDIK